ncbi:MAG: hypothetical protein HY906_17475 [Deltaproteobacteria bacterium]|nr:hypothetical protein [Deltaproteobacteria bacterium]
MRTCVLMLLLVLALGAAACGGKGGGNNQDAAPTDAAPGDVAPGDAARDADGDGPQATDGGGDGGGNPCPRTPAAAERVRKVVVSHPYDKADGGLPVHVPAWEVLDLSTTGTLTQPGVTFNMGVAMYGEVVFTPDGEVGIAVQEDGTLGVFRFDSNGTPHVVHTGFGDSDTSFYASSVVMDPDGTGAWVLDGEWRNIGGGIYRVAIGCDGTLTDQGRVAEAKLPAGLVLLPDGRAVVSAYDLLTSTAGTGLNDVHLLGSLKPPALSGSVSAFPTSDGGADEQIVSAAAATSDGRYVLYGDNSEFRDYGGTRIAAVEAQAGGLRAAQVFDFNDPLAIVASPFGHPLIGVSGYGDAIFVIDYNSQSATPFSVRGELPHIGTGPQLPGAAVMIRRGSLEGFVLVAELSGVRQVAFHSDYTVTDLGAFDFGSGYTAMVGAIGVQP